MSQRKLIVVLVFASITALVGTTWLQAAADEEAGASFDLAEITCWDVMTLNEEDRGIVLFLLYGYVAGEKGQSVHTSQGIEKLLRGVGEYCADNPDTVALAAMKEASK